MGLGLQLAARTTPVEKKNTKRAISNLLHGTVLLPPPLIDLTAISLETHLPLSRSYHHRLCPATTLFDLGKNSSDCSIGALTLLWWMSELGFIGPPQQALAPELPF